MILQIFTAFYNGLVRIFLDFFVRVHDNRCITQEVNEND